MAVPEHTTTVGAVVAPGLWLVATPIGNLGDLTDRARTTLARAELVCCEDTRRTGALLTRLGIARPTMVVVNEHTEHDATRTVLAALAAGRIVALVSDAGMPAISDPGALIVRAAIDAGHEVRPVPGASALTSALAVSGLDTSRFAFEGFLPRQGPKRRARLADIAEETRTTVLFEAPHRIVRTLTDLAGTCDGTRAVCIAREMTKIHEDFWRGSLDDALAHVTSGEPRGEYVVVLGGRSIEESATSDDRIRAALAERLGEGSTRRDAVDRVARDLSVQRRRVYAIALDESNGSGTAT
jgi:16S rRNA (cytidine1402-2'-O)-methyltransferase